MKTLEERKLNEKESLELIAQMIQNSKKRLEVGGGNTFLLWGYITVGVAIVVFVLLWLTENPNWLWIWFAIPILGYPLSYWMSKREVKPMTYIDKIITNIWKLVGSMCVIAPLLGINYSNNIPILPLLLLILSFGSGVTGAIIEEKSLYNTSGIGIVISMAMLFNISLVSETLLRQIAVFIILIVAMMIIPGHIINRKAKKARQED